MGWMAWEAYRTNVNEGLVRNTTMVMVRDNWLASGYDTVHIDDGWSLPTRDPVTNEIRADPSKFPNGIASLASFVHSHGMKLGLYSSASPVTCAGYMGSEGHESQDAKTFASWGVDYLKYDACQKNRTRLAASYRAMGAALSTTKIAYSCSWGAAIGKNWPFADFVDAGCDTWRLWHDIEAKKGWSDVVRISEHWADSYAELRNWSGPPSSGRGWHDPDQLLAGDPQLTPVESVAQFALWAHLSAPLIMGNRLADPSTMAPELRKAMQV